jgi:hypothetical protein
MEAGFPSWRSLNYCQNDDLAAVISGRLLIVDLCHLYPKASNGTGCYGCACLS